MFGSLLIANRGEIACRVIRTARRMGLRTIAVYSDADRDALHVAMADEAYRIGPPAARESYLRIDAILDAARRAKAQAVHPGYGFLSENADFTEACAAAGVIFVGPPPEAIRAMGGKSEAKALMERAGVPLVPGYHGEAQDDATLAAAADRIGFPVLIKASAGGGGKGMRVVTSAAQFADQLAGAKREARAAFGDERVLIERYLQRPRHIEIQVFADTHGNCISLFERDCSVQRRHQKVVEEAPAPGLPQATRAAMGEAAVAAARAVGYVGAGTVEFIVEDERFAFMEMNTRLQVEHPVTEFITGLDLVELQLRVAAGEPLPTTTPTIDGHAIEVRIYAEDPAQDYRPSVGTLTHLRAPDGVRIDTGVRQGDRIGIEYDPMIAKLIAHGPDRAAALRRLRTALAHYEVVGVTTNLALLRGIASDPEFAAGGVDTGFLARHPSLLAPSDTTPPPEAIAAATLAVIARDKGGESPWNLRDMWRMNLPGSRTVGFASGAISVAIDGDAYRLEWDGNAHLANLRDSILRLDDRTLPVSIIDGGATITVVLSGSSYSFDCVDPLAPPASASVGSHQVLAPIPGRIASVLVAVGDTVARGQALVILEAMKMELTLSAPADGTVAEIRCRPGDMVEERTELVTFATVSVPAT